MDYGTSKECNKEFVTLSTDNSQPAPADPRKIRTSNQQQCQKLYNKINAALMEEPDLFRILPTLEIDEKRQLIRYTMIGIILNECSCNAHLFWKWAWDTFEKGTINYSDFARAAGVHRSYVIQTIRPQAIRLFVETVKKCIPLFLID